VILADGTIWVAHLGKCDACGGMLGHPSGGVTTVGTVISCGHCFHAMVISETGVARRLTPHEADKFWGIGRDGIEGNMREAERKFWG
jgi:hypothetical protein